MEPVVENWMSPDPLVLGMGPREWEMPNGERVTGTYIGFWSSQSKVHEHAGDVVPDGQHCQACRWFEMSLWTTGDVYVLVRHNVSEVPDEQDRVRVVRADTPADLVDLLGFKHKPLKILLERASMFDPACSLAETTGHEPRRHNE